MAAGLPKPAVFKIPVKQVAIETYKLMWEHRRRIAYWSIVPFILFTLIWIGDDELASLDFIKGSYVLETTLSLATIILGTLFTVPFRVAIHRLTYPGFDFDHGSHGPPLNVINTFYFIYSLIIIVIPWIIIYVLNYYINIIKDHSFAFISSILVLVSFVFYGYIVFAFTFIFPETALGIKPSFLQARWKLQGNLSRLIASVLLTTIPVIILSFVPYQRIYLSLSF